MSCLYVVEQGAKVTLYQGNFCVECRNGLRRIVPSEILESIMIFGRASMTLECQKKCLQKGIRVSFLSSHGHYFGHLEPTTHVNAGRLKKQVYLSDNQEQTMLFAKNTLKAKVHNQGVLLRRYARNSSVDISEERHAVSIYEKKMEQTESLKEVMGYEGIAARSYFQALSRLVQPAFRFNGRNKRPPKDPFNSMLSLGYTILFYEIYAELEARGISPYIGFVHQIRERHPTLVSDLLEEWRAVIVDAVVLSLVQGNEISIDQFSRDEDTGGVIISDEGVKILVQKLEQKMRANMNYLDYQEGPVSFRRGIWWQVKSLAHCLDIGDLSEYHPLRIR